MGTAQAIENTSPLQNNNEFHFLTTTLEAWQSMLSDCQKANTSIFFEQYILANDEWGQRFLEVFLNKAKQGVKVTVVLDFIGSHDVVNHPLVHDIRAHGGTVTFYRPLKWLNIFTPQKWFPRTHLKCMIIDNEIGYLGSGCVAKRMETWRDTYVRITDADFMKRINLFDIIERKHKKAFGKQVSHNDRDNLTLQINRPRVHRNPVYKDLIHHINRAESSIRIATPYFIPPRMLSKSLIKAAKRGVDVTIMASERTDITLADLAAFAEYPRHLNAGVTVMLYTPSVLHTKYTVIDNKWATIGSTNIDYLSLYKNRESNLSGTNKAFVENLNTHFTNDIPHCKIITLDYCSGQSGLKKISCFAAKYLKKIL